MSTKFICFLNFDIVDFYPSTKRNHLLNAIKFCGKYSLFSDQELQVIMHICESVLCYNHKVWKKSGNDTNFDIPMGSFHGAEIFHLIRLYILNEITLIIGPNCIGLYRNEGLSVLKQTSGSNIEKIKKSPTYDLRSRLTSAAQQQTSLMSISIQP